MQAGDEVLAHRMNGNLMCSSWGVPSSLPSPPAAVRVEVSHATTQMTLTPYRWWSNKIKRAWIPEVTESPYIDEET